LNTTADVSTIVLSAVVGYQCLLLAVGLWASRRTHSSSDFFLGGRKVGPWVTGISYSASASSAWTLLGVSGAAFAIGPSVVWVALGSLLGDGRGVVVDRTEAIGSKPSAPADHLHRLSL
jgi:sodium/proline symporter